MVNQVNKKMLRAAKILERMVNQNTYDEIAQGIPFQGFIMSHDSHHMVNQNTYDEIAQGILFCQIYFNIQYKRTKNIKDFQIYSKMRIKNTKRQKKISGSMRTPLTSSASLKGLFSLFGSLLLREPRLDWEQA